MRCHKHADVIMKSTRYSCSILMKLEFSQQIYGKSSDVKFSENRLSESRVPCGRADRFAEANTRFSKFANAPKNLMK